MLVSAIIVIPIHLDVKLQRLSFVSSGHLKFTFLDISGIECASPSFQAYWLFRIIHLRGSASLDLQSYLLIILGNILYFQFNIFDASNVAGYFQSVGPFPYGFADA